MTELCFVAMFFAREPRSPPLVYCKTTILSWTTAKQRCGSRLFSECGSRPEAIQKVCWTRWCR